MKAGHGKEGENTHVGSLRNETEYWNKNSPVPGKFLETDGAALVRPSEISGKEHSSLWGENFATFSSFL